MVAILEVADGGLFHHNTTRDLHMVMQVDGEILQPQSKEQLNSSWTGNYWVTTTFVSMRFVYSMPSAAMIRFLFVGADGKEHPLKADISKLR